MRGASLNVITSVKLIQRVLRWYSQRSCHASRSLRKIELNVTLAHRYTRHSNFTEVAIEFRVRFVSKVQYQLCWLGKINLREAKSGKVNVFAEQTLRVRFTVTEYKTKSRSLILFCIIYK